MKTQKTQKDGTDCREIRVGRTVYRVTSVYLGETDLKSTLERLAVNRALAEINAAGEARANH